MNFSNLPRKSIKNTEAEVLHELEDESESYADYGTQMVELTKNLHIEATQKKKRKFDLLKCCRFKTRLKIRKSVKSDQDNEF